MKRIILIILLVLSPGCSSELHHQLSEREANRIMVLLIRQGLDAKKSADRSGSEGLWTVTVPSEQYNQAMELLAENNLPREFGDGIQRLMESKELIPSEKMESARFAAALCEELENTLKTVDGVLSARVHLDLPEHRKAILPGQLEPKPSASVLVKVHPEKSVLSDEQIRNLVAGSIHRLTPDDVTVVRLEVTGYHPVRAAGQVRQSSESESIRYRWIIIASVAAMSFMALAMMWHGIRTRRRISGTPAIQPDPAVGD